MEQKEQNANLKQHKDTLTKRIEALQNELLNENQKHEDTTEELDSIKKDYE